MAMSSTESGEGIVTFFRMIPDCPPPQRADRSAGGMLPTRAFRYCDPVTTASAFGWYVFPPFAFSLQFDGTNIKWTFGTGEQWYSLGTAQYPDFAQYFDEHAPDDLKGYSPPFITAFPEPGYVQIWSGLIARTKPGWSLLIRPVPNFPRSLSYELFEGIVETDSWFGPLFTNLRLKKTDYEGRLLDDFNVVAEMKDWSGADWDSYRDTVVAPNLVEHRLPGKHAVKLRRRRRSE
jgi:hypothetical protein